MVVTVRAFDVHEVFVVQYDGESPKLGEARPGRFVFPRETYIRDQSRGVAYIGKYPGAATAREMRMPLREHPLPFLDTPIDYPKFSQDHCLIAASPSTIAKRHVQHLADYVRQGGLLHLFSGAGAYEDTNGNYREDDGQYSNVRSSLFEQVTGPVINRRPKHRYTYINRVRFTRKHPIFEGLPVGQWIDLQPAEAGQEKQWWYQSQRFDVPRGAKDALVEAEVWSYNTALTIPGERQGVYRYPEPKILAGSNYADVGFDYDANTGRIVAIAAIDNLMKGAAGTAVQCLNIMCGWDETAGLTFAGLHPA